MFKSEISSAFKDPLTMMYLPCLSLILSVTLRGILLLIKIATPLLLFVKDEK